MLEAMVPVYQKHLNKGDVDASVLFYSSPRGQKMLRDMMQERLQQPLEEMEKEATAKSKKDSQAPPK